MNTRRVLVLSSAIVVALMVLIASGPRDVIDLPAWANIRGVDVPLVGDTDQLVCKLEQVDGTDRVEITLHDGDVETHGQYTHVWNNGMPIVEGEIERLDEDRLRVPSTPGTNDQYYSVSMTPNRDDRLYCSLIVLE